MQGYPHEGTSHLDMLDETAGEGELPVDIAETTDELIVRAPVAGCDPDNISIHLDGDVLTIRGTRERESDATLEHFFTEECFWGNFSRSIILPVDVKGDEAQATFKNGMLILRFPKQFKAQHIPIMIIHED